jgi:hypothetical protein
MNEPQFGNRIRQILNQGLQLEARKAARLRAAREAALARHRPERAPALQWADNVLGRVGGIGGLSLRVLLPAAAVVIAAAALYGWQQNRRAADIEELDAQLLTDELPIDAYLDRGFQSWLKKRTAEQ